MASGADSGSGGGGGATAAGHNGLTYADAGVSIDAGDALVARIGPAAASTRRPGVLGGLGGFAGLFDLAATGVQDPILVAATDGVGTKLKLAIDAGAPEALDGLGQDLVAMCVNDLAAQGATPLFFLDYFATGHLETDRAARVVEGVAAGCRLAGAALLGGETAEMPGLYQDGEFDLAGFTVGVVARNRLLPRPIAEGDAIIGVASDGAHANGFSLIRKILALKGLTPDAPAPWAPDATVATSLLRPTRIYTGALAPLLAETWEPEGLRGLAHITGGGLVENPPRALAATPGRADLALSIDLDRLRTALPPDPLFGYLAAAGGVAEREMLRTFNCGVGLTLFAPEDAAPSLIATLAAGGERAAVIGAVVAEPGAAGAVRFHGRLFDAP